MRHSSLRWRLLRWAALCAAFWIVAIALFYGIENWRGWREWRIERDALLARGRFVDLKDFVPPPVPDDQNFALNPILRPLLEYDPPLREGEAIRWHDTNGMRRGFDALNFGGRYDDRTQPDLGLWTQGEPVDLTAWQIHFRSPRMPEEIRKARARRGLPEADVPPVEDDPSRLPGTPLGIEPGRPGEDVLLGLSMVGDDLDLLQRAAALPHSRFPVHYDEGYATLLPHLAKLKQMSRLFALRSVAHLAENRTDAAFADALTSLRVAEAVADEPFLICQLVRQASLVLALQAVWEGQIRHAWTEPQLARFTEQLQPLRPLDDVRRSFHAERAQLLLIIQRMIRSPRARTEYAEMVSQLRDHDGSPWYAPTGPLLLYLHLAPRGWLYANLAASSRRIEELATLSPTAVPALSSNPPPVLAGPSLRLFLHHHAFLPHSGTDKGLPGAISKAVRSEAQVRLAFAACALERHWRAHGEYPPDLKTLVPRFLAEVPADPLTDRPLRYEREAADRFRLWSVGTDGQDQDGKVLAKPGEALAPGDWVWRWPEGSP